MIVFSCLPVSKIVLTDEKAGKLYQGSHRLEKYLNIEDFLEKCMKIKSALTSTGKSLKGLEFYYFM